MRMRRRTERTRCCAERTGKKKKQKPGTQQGNSITSPYERLCWLRDRQSFSWASTRKQGQQGLISHEFQFIQKSLNLKPPGLHAEDVQRIWPRVADILILSLRAKMIRIIPKHRRGAGHHALPRAIFKRPTEKSPCKTLLRQNNILIFQERPPSDTRAAYTHKTRSLRGCLRACQSKGAKHPRVKESRCERKKPTGSQFFFPKHQTAKQKRAKDVMNAMNIM